MSDPFTLLDDVIFAGLREGPMTVAELADYTYLPVSQVGPRVRQLVGEGRVVQHGNVIASGAPAAAVAFALPEGGQ